MKMISETCSECGGYGYIDASTFGDRGMHPCFHCGTTGKATYTERMWRKRQRFAGPTIPCAFPYRIMIGHDEHPTSYTVGYAMTLRWAFVLADREGGEDTVGFVVNRQGGRMSRPWAPQEMLL